MSRPINKFEGEYAFLSNFYPSKVWLNGMEFATVEHAYQAAKSLEPEVRAKIQEATSPGSAKKMGRAIALRDDWGTFKFTVMKTLLDQKFTLHSDLRRQLLKTGSRELIEGNYWHDNIWGVCTCPRPGCNGKGDNNLGKQLMQVRQELKEKQ